MAERTSEQGSSAVPEGSPGDRRRSERRAVPGVFVAVEVSDRSGETSWTGSVIDLSAHGIALTIPESVPTGTELLLTFKLGPNAEFARVPGTVVRRHEGFGVGAVRWDRWSEDDMRALRAHLDL